LRYKRIMMTPLLRSRRMKRDSPDTDLEVYDDNDESIDRIKADEERVP
jgi:hypothetical protein